MNSTKSESEFDTYSQYSVGSDLNPSSDPFRLTLEVLECQENIGSLWDLYQPLFECVDSDVKLLSIAERLPELEENYTSREQNRVHSGRNTCSIRINYDTQLCKNGLQYANQLGQDGHSASSSQSNDGAPMKQGEHWGIKSGSSSQYFALSVVLFLTEGPHGSFGSAKQYLCRHPWMYHYSDAMINDRYIICPPNNADYYTIHDDLPSWSVRQIHCGRQHVRFQLTSTYTNWSDNIDVYRLIIGSDPDVWRQDFCVFTAYQQHTYDVQFALKRAPKGQRVNAVKYARLQFRVSDIGRLVPLFPNVCTPISDTRWKTSDHDGNCVIVQTVGNTNYRSVSCLTRDNEGVLLGFYV